MNVPPLQVLDELRLQRLRIREVGDADGNGSGLGKLGCAITPGSGNDLEALLGDGADKQGRKHSLSADALGKLSKGCILEDAAGVGGGLGKDVEGKIAILGCGLRVHGCSP
jgi:hypothetical protein